MNPSPSHCFVGKKSKLLFLFVWNLKLSNDVPRFLLTFLILCSFLLYLIPIFASVQTHQYIERTKELKQITERRNLCRQGYEEARKNRLQEFMNSFNIISNKLKELYQMLTMGGDAELDLNDSLDPFTEGINFWYCIFFIEFLVALLC